MSKSAYAECIFEFWDRLGRPDIEEMIAHPNAFTVEDDVSIKTGKPMPPIDQMHALTSLVSEWGLRQRDVHLYETGKVAAG